MMQIYSIVFTFVVLGTQQGAMLYQSVPHHALCSGAQCPAVT